MSTGQGLEGDFVGVEAIGGVNVGKRRSYPMSSFERRAVEEGSKKPFYIYSVNPVHEWPIQHGQLGTVLIRKRPADKKLSEPTVIAGVIARQYDKGLGKKEWFLEEGVEIVEDLLGCSVKYPAPTQNNNLTTFGVFYTEVPFEDLQLSEQKTLLADANEKMVRKLQMTILEADRFHAEGHGNWIAQIHRDSLHFLNEVTGAKEERPWAPIRITAGKVECLECGHMNKPHVRICYNCKAPLETSAPKSKKAKEKED